MTFQTNVYAVPASEIDGMQDVVPTLGAQLASTMSNAPTNLTLTLAEARQRADETKALGDVEVYDGISAEVLDLYIRRVEKLGPESRNFSAPSGSPRTMTEALINPGPAPKGAEYWSGSAAPIIWDIGKGIFVEGPKQLFAGVADGIGNTLLAVDELAGWLNRNVADLRFSTLLGHPDTSNPEMNSPEFKKFAEGFKSIEHGDTVTGSLIRNTAAFLTGLALTRRVPGLGGAGKLPMIAAGSLSAFLTMGPDDPGLANLIQEHPALANPITEFLATKPGDNAALNRFKHALEELGLGILGEGLLLAVSTIRSARIAKAGFKNSDTRLLEAEERRLLTHRAGEDTDPLNVKSVSIDEPAANDNLRADNDNVPAANDNAPPPRRPFIGLLDVIRNSIDGSLDRIEAMTDAELTELWAGKVGKNAPGGGRMPDSIIGYDVDLAVKRWFNEYLPDWNTQFEARGRVSGKWQKPDFASLLGIIEFKPGTKSGLRAGEKQAARYEDELGVPATYMTYELNEAQKLRLELIRSTSGHCTARST